MSRTTTIPGARKVGEDVMLDVQQVAAFLNVKRDAVYALKDSGDLPHVRVGRKLIRFWRSDVQRFADLNRTG